MAKKFLKSFSYASEGLSSAFKTQRNFRIQLIIGTFSLLLALLAGFNRVEWIILLLCIYLVLFSELLNTIVETVVDLATSSISPKAKLAKDVAAGVVLLNAIIVLLVGFLLFAPHLLLLFQ